MDVALAEILAWLDSLDLDGRRQQANGQAVPDTSLAALHHLADAADSTDAQERSAGIRACFAGLVEPCNDRLDGFGRLGYELTFPSIVWRCVSRIPELAQLLQRFGIHDEEALRAGYGARRRRAPSAPAEAPTTIAVLSRVTLGADILITSVLCQRLHQTWPGARIVVLGDTKMQGLLGGLPGVQVFPLSYGRRGGLGERLASWKTLVDSLDAIDPDLVVSPDSRLDQLGILPVVDDPSRYLLWENLLEGPQSLATAVSDWCDRWCAPAAVTPRIAFDGPTDAMVRTLRQAWGDRPTLALKFDHGGNPAKSLPREAEVALLQRAQALGWRLLLDRGFGDEELAASDALLAAAGITPLDLDGNASGLGLAPEEWSAAALAEADCLRFYGSIAGWAAACSCCQGAVSYDSVGHHLAAALGVPLLSIFTGFDHPDFPIAWQPRGPGHIVQVVIPTAERALPQHLDRALAGLFSPSDCQS
jgi:ADP-heptose:LPS heptosyltransferase